MQNEICVLVVKEKEEKSTKKKVFHPEKFSFSLATMSVFSDFQRLWVSQWKFQTLRRILIGLGLQQEKFPDSDLSTEWIKDVKLSLERHREKIVELTTELEQEKLYVEYLERLLGEVERSRDSGTNTALILDAATPTINSSPSRLSAIEKNGPTDNKDSEVC